MANARQFMWMQGEFTGLAHPVWSSPSGYFSPSLPPAPSSSTRSVAAAQSRAARAFEDQIRDQQIIAGTPKTVIPKLRRAARGDAPVHPGLLGAPTAS